MFGSQDGVSGVIQQGASVPHTYFVTGSNRGLGLEFVRQLSRRGDVVVGSVREVAQVDAGDEHAASLVPLELTDQKSIDSLPERVGDRSIDVLINNAGVSSDSSTLARCDAAELHRVFSINSIAPVLVTRALLPNLRKGSRKLVVTVSSQLGSITNNSGGSSYGYRASKAAVNMLTVSMHHELKGEGFTCVVVHPGWVQTDMGGPNAPLKPDESVGHLIRLIDRLTAADSGRFFNYDGTTLPW
ncbi:MAG: SDR family oxidoreductase [Phycisphaeraceae bacterium]|nr:MAG: SDR family oxidoreductase [Phycisphaeraceae bacterium]